VRGLDLIGSTVLVSDGLPTERKNDILFDSAQAVLNQLGLPKSAYDATQRDAIFTRATLWCAVFAMALCLSLCVCLSVAWWYIVSKRPIG